MLNVNATSVLKVVATIDPASITGAEVFSDPIDMGIWESVLAVACTGTLDGGAVDFKVYQCDSAGANATAAIKHTVQLASDPIVNGDGQLVMAFRADEMPSKGALGYAKFGLTIGANGGPAVVLVIGVATRYSPGAAKQLNAAIAPSLASVVETIA